tara:strand:+ start:539 stop:727 length:189 start_codon:yes stop_codon:yes gene_type:complete
MINISIFAIVSFFAWSEQAQTSEELPSLEGSPFASDFGTSAEHRANMEWHASHIAKLQEEKK